MLLLLLWIVIGIKECPNNVHNLFNHHIFHEFRYSVCQNENNKRLYHSFSSNKIKQKSIILIPYIKIYK